MIGIRWLIDALRRFGVPAASARRPGPHRRRSWRPWITMGARRRPRRTLTPPVIRAAHRVWDRRFRDAREASRRYQRIGRLVRVFRAAGWPELAALIDQDRRGLVFGRPVMNHVRRAA